MYQGTENEKWKYTFNYNGEKDEVVIQKSLVAVNYESTKDKKQWGPFVTYNNSFLYKEDPYGNFGLELGKSTSGIAKYSIEQSLPINEKYSLGILVNGTTNQISNYRSETAYPDGLKYDANTIIAISDAICQYTCWISLIENNLRIYTYAPIEDVSEELGFITVDVSKYDNKFMYIQLTAQKNGKSNLYINGEHVKEFTSGTKDLTYNTLTVGDLRPGRNLKYEGIIYDTAIYGMILTEQEIMNNWKYIKTQYHLNDSGEQE